MVQGCDINLCECCVELGGLLNNRPTDEDPSSRKLARSQLWAQRDAAPLPCSR